MRYALPALLLMVCCCLAGCGGSSVDADAWYEGTWTDSYGQSGRIRFETTDLSSDDTRAIDGVVRNQTADLSADMTGTWDYLQRELDITLSFPGMPEERWQGTMTSVPATMTYTGTLTRTRGGNPYGTVNLEFEWTFQPDIF